jgi:integrase
MRAPFSAKRYRNKWLPKKKWEVDGRINGKRTRRTFESEREAKAFAHLRNIELKEHGSNAIQLSTYERIMAQRCRDELAAFDLTIEDATKLVLEREKARKQSCAIEAIFEQFIESLRIRELTAHYIGQFRRLSRYMCAVFRDKFVSDLSTRDLEEFLTNQGPNWSASSRNQHRRELVTVWVWAKKLGYCSDEVARNITVVKAVEKPVGILQPEQLARLLATAPPKLLPGLAIGAFAGLRVSEICRLDWNEIDLEAGLIRVAPAKTKTARYRDVQILPCLAAWLRPFEKSNGPVAPSADIGYFDELRQSVAEKVGITKWPGNALRHSFASYHIAHFKDAPRLALEMGHTTTYLIFSHYRALVRSVRAAEYWQIIPFSRPELATIYAFMPTAYPWRRTVGRVAEGDWIDGVKNLAHYFGVDYRLPYWWFSEIPDCPPRPADDRFHIPTWRNFVKNHPGWRSNRNAERALPFYVSWYCDAGHEMRTYFATEDEAMDCAERNNRERLAKELRLDQIANVIEFPSGDTAQSSLPLPTIGNAGSVD